MVVSTDGAAESVERGTPDPGRPGPEPGGGGTRRGLMRGLFASAATAALSPLVAASHPPRPAGAPPAHDGPADTPFDETYRGRRIRGRRTDAGRTPGTGEWYVTVDGRHLHLMRRADGTWLTMVDHYGSYATPLEAARAAVDEMGPGRRLRDTDHGHAHEDQGGHHGVHP